MFKRKICQKREFLSQLKKFEDTVPCILKSTKFVDMVMKLPEIHAKGFEILDKFSHKNGSFCQSSDSR